MLVTDDGVWVAVSAADVSKAMHSDGSASPWPNQKQV